MNRRLLWLLGLVGFVTITWAEGNKDDTKTSNTFRLDVRVPFRGGRILHGMERISPVAEEENTEAKLTVDDITATGWKVSSPQYVTTKLNDGWHDFALTEGENTAITKLLVLNGGGVAIHEGILSKSETWSADKVHVVRHWVRVPENVTLTVAANAVVKFCEDTGILVDGKLNASKAMFTTISDDSVGGDTDCNPNGLSLVMYDICGDGIIEISGCVDRRECSPVVYELGVTDDGLVSDSTRLDVRAASRGGRILHGTERISSVAAEETATAVLAVDDASTTVWSVANLRYNSAILGDGWHDFALTEGEEMAVARLLVLNGGGVVIHEGVLSKNETWTADKVHVVRHWVRVPENVTLTVAANAVVKFCEDTGILVDGKLKASNATFTVITDDVVRGDTDMNEDAVSLVLYDICGEGAIELADCCDRRYYNYGSYSNGIANGQISSETFRLDIRSSIGGRMLVGDEYISPLAEVENDNAKLTVDGAELAGWNVDSPWIDSTKLKNNQWHVFSLNEGYGTFENELLPMNRDDVVVHEGVLEKDETWEKEKLHVVRHWVRVPKDVTLIIKTKAVVKFCEDTGILVDEGGRLTGEKAVFSSVMDDSDGDDTDMNGRSAAMGYGFYDITGDGTIDLTDCDNRGLASLIEDTVWKAGDIIHVIGQLKVPSGVSLSIQSGAIVKFTTGASLLADGGIINAQNALFTHIADDSETAGGDTNGDGDATSPVYDAYTLPNDFEPNLNGIDDNGNEIRYITPQPYTGGTIASGETKVLAGNRVHRVTGDIVVNGTLIVQPGAIVKMDGGPTNKKLSITVNNGGTLEALGNRAQPIVFTSIKDDAHGGDTNGDGNETKAAAGDWERINAGGTVKMNYVTIAYLNKNQTDRGAIQGTGGSVTFDNGVIEYSHYECVRMNSGSFIAHNSVFRESTMGFGYYGGNGTTCINCIITSVDIGCRASNKHFKNCIFYKVASTFMDSSGSTFDHCLFYNPPNYIDSPQSFSQTGKNGNIWADPLFTDPENGDFTLKAGSPCIDAGDGTVAPEFDYWGKPRMNVAKIADSGVPNADGVCPDIGIYEMPGVGGGAMPDLSVSDVAFEGKAYRHGDVMTVTWHDANDGDAAAIGPWRDIVSLVRKEEQVTYVVEAASVTVPATLKSGRSQSMSASFKLPALLPGEWQIQVAANQYRDVFEGEGGASNILLSEETFTVEMDGIPVGNSSFQVASDSQKTFMLSGGAANGAVLRLTAPKGTELSVTASAGRIPTEDDFHWRGVQVTDGQWIVEIPKGVADDVFVTVANDGDSSANVSAQRSGANAAIFGTDVSEVANGGMASVVIYGAGLDKAAAAELGTVPATNIHVLSSMELVASFDLTNMAIGDYQLTVTLEGGRVLTMDGALMVSQGAIGPKLMAGFSMPETLRPGRWYSGTITYRNDGDRDAIAPLLYLTGHDVTFLDTDDGFTEHAGHIVLAGLAADGDPSVIRPGRTYTVNVKFRGTNANATSVGIHFTFLDPNEDPLEWKMLLGGDDEMFAKRKADLEADFGTPLGLLKAAYDVCGHCSQYGQPMLDVLSVMEKLAAKPDDVEYGYVSGVMVSRDDGQALANCSLVVDGGENDVCYVKTDGGGRFCAWGVPVGRNVTFGGPEGVYYFADGEVTLDSDQKSGVSVYRLAEDNSTPQKTHTIADYKLVKDSDGVVWMVWLADDVLYAALADDPEHTTVSLPSDVKWTEMTAFPLDNGGLRFFLNSTKENENENDDVREILYTCTATIGQGGDIEFSSVKSHDDNRSYGHLDITGLSNGKYAALWYDLSQGLQLQCMDIENSHQWEDSVIYVPVEQTRGGTTFKGGAKFKMPGIGEVSLVLSGSHEETCCSKKSSGGIALEDIDISLPTFWLGGKLNIEGEIHGSYEKEWKCQYYFCKDTSDDCIPDYQQSLLKISGGLEAFAGPKWHLGSITAFSSDFLTFDFEAKAGLNVYLDIEWEKNYYGDSSASDNWQYSCGIGGKLSGKATVTIGKSLQTLADSIKNIYKDEIEKLTVKDKNNVKDVGEISGYCMFNFIGNSLRKLPEYKNTELSLTVQFLIFQYDGIWIYDGEWHYNYNITWQYKKDLTRGKAEDEIIQLEASEMFPHDLIIEINSTDMTCQLDNASFSEKATCIMSTFTPDNGSALQLTGGTILGLRNGGVACFISKEEYVDGYKNACLLYMDIDGQNRIRDVVRLYSEDGDYVHGAIKAVEMEDGNLAVLYNVSTLDYTGSISDYLQSLGRYKTYLITRENGQWGEPMLVGNESARSMTMCYDEKQKELKITWLEDNGNGKAFVNLCTYSNGTLSESQRLLSCDNDTASSLSMIVKTNGELVFSWLEEHKSEVVAKFASLSEDEWQTLSFVLPLERVNEYEEEQTRGGIDWLDKLAMTRGTTNTYIEACDHCVEKNNKNCDCGCAKKKSEYIPDECKCNRSISSHLIPADCAKDHFDCYDCKCKETGYNQRSSDPNEIVGVTGMGDPSTQRFVRPGDWLEYTVYFENKATADVPAQEIYIDMALNPAVVDMRSLTFGDVVFGSQTVDALNGRKANGTFSVTQKGTRYLVNGEATRDARTGAIHWYMRSYDASAEENGFFPEDIHAGFLPPNDGTHRGEGHVAFRVKVKDNAPDGAFINAEAVIVFDANDPITTSPAWFNWVTMQENPVADNTTLRWDTSCDAAGTTYVVNYWSGDPDPTSENTTVTFNSDTLATGSWKIADGLAPGTWYWNVTKTNGDDSSKTSTWSFDILATHSLTVNGGIGGGMYRTNTRVTAEANTVDGKTFTGWTAVGLDMSEAELSEKRLVFYMPDNDVTLTANYEEEKGILLLPGWNLIAVPGDLLEEGNAAFIAELNPFVLNRKSMAYVRAALPLPAGEPLWIYSARRQQVPLVYEDANGVVGGLTSKRGWHLIGVGGSESVEMDNVLAAWQWSADRWTPLKINDRKVTLFAGRGYFIYKE